MSLFPQRGSKLPRFTFTYQFLSIYYAQALILMWTPAGEHHTSMTKSSGRRWEMRMGVECYSSTASPDPHCALCQLPHWVHGWPHALHWPRGKGNISRHESQTWKPPEYLGLLFLENIHHIKRTRLANLLLQTQGRASQPCGDCSCMSESEDAGWTA